MTQQSDYWVFTPEKTKIEKDIMDHNVHHSTIYTNKDMETT